MSISRNEDFNSFEYVDGKTIILNCWESEHIFNARVRLLTQNVNQRNGYYTLGYIYNRRANYIVNPRPENKHIKCENCTKVHIKHAINHTCNVCWCKLSCDKGCMICNKCINCGEFRDVSTVYNHECIHCKAKNPCLKKNCKEKCEKYKIEQDKLVALKRHELLKTSFEWYTKASNKEYEFEKTKAEYSIGYYYQHGLGVPQDYKKAVEFYTKAADKNLDLAYNALAICYVHGIGVEKDSEKVKFFSEKASISEEEVIKGLKCNICKTRRETFKCTCCNYGYCNVCASSVLVNKKVVRKACFSLNTCLIMEKTKELNEEMKQTIKAFQKFNVPNVVQSMIYELGKFKAMDLY